MLLLVAVLAARQTNVLQPIDFIVISGENFAVHRLGVLTISR
jgi:hypothetical protein